MIQSNKLNHTNSYLIVEDEDLKIAEIKCNNYNNMISKNYAQISQSEYEKHLNQHEKSFNNRKEILQQNFSQNGSQLIETNVSYQNNSKSNRSFEKSIINNVQSQNLKQTEPTGQLKKANSDNSHYLFNTGSIQTIPRNSSEKYILTYDELGRFSFLNEQIRQKEKGLPTPIYMNYSLLNNMNQITKESLLNGLTRTSTGKLKCTNKEILDKYKGIFVDLIKKVGQSVAEGRGIVGVSLPVRIFEPRSMIERIVDCWSFAPIFLSKAASLIDPLERMKNVMAFAFAGISVSISQLKPFNPILGETYEGMFPDGSKIYCEHTSHHPPISNFLILGKGYRYYGRYEYTAKPNNTFNQITMQTEGPNMVEFDDGQKIQFSMPGLKIKGMIMGDRLMNFDGCLTLVDSQNNLKAVIKMSGVSKKQGMFTKKFHDQITGQIFSTSSISPTSKFKNQKEQNKYDLKFEDMQKSYGEITGKWLENLIINGKEIWNIDHVLPHRQKSVENPLPSDCRFREDLLWLKYGDQKQAEKWKMLLEERQRFEKKLRQDNKRQ